MISPRYRRHVMLLACGLLGLPILISFQQSSCCSSHAECGCAPPGDLFNNLANAQSSDLEPPNKRPPLSEEAKAALQRLIEGNQRFVNGKPLHQHTSLEWRRKTAQEQKPFAAILGCSDSRVPPEVIFDQGLGDLFVVRVAGNIVDADVSGSLEYAGFHLGTQLFVVLGHEQCGAVSAVMEVPEESDEPRGLQMLLERIRPALKTIDPKLPKEKRIADAVESNVRWSMAQLASVSRHKKALDEGRIFLVGAVYALDTGKVRMLE